MLLVVLLRTEDISLPREVVQGRRVPKDGVVHLTKGIAVEDVLQELFFAPGEEIVGTNDGVRGQKEGGLVGID